MWRAYVSCIFVSSSPAKRAAAASTPRLQRETARRFCCTSSDAGVKVKFVRQQKQACCSRKTQPAARPTKAGEGRPNKRKTSPVLPTKSWLGYSGTCLETGVTPGRAGAGAGMSKMNCRPVRLCFAGLMLPVSPAFFVGLANARFMAREGRVGGCRRLLTGGGGQSFPLLHAP